MIAKFKKRLVVPSTTLSILIILIGACSFAQQIEWQPLTREIGIAEGDSVVKARISIAG